MQTKLIGVDILVKGEMQIKYKANNEKHKICNKQKPKMVLIKRKEIYYLINSYVYESTDKYISNGLFLMKEHLSL